MTHEEHAEIVLDFCKDQSYDSRYIIIMMILWNILVNQVMYTPIGLDKETGD